MPRTLSVDEIVEELRIADMENGALKETLAEKNMVIANLTAEVKTLRTITDEDYETIALMHFTIALLKNKVKSLEEVIADMEKVADEAAREYAVYMSRND